jgi:hypothetical protein
MGIFSDKGGNAAQKNTDAIIRKHGGKAMSGKDKGKWDMKDGVDREKAKGGKK